MKKMILVACSLFLMSGLAFAQAAQPAQSGDGMMKKPQEKKAEKAAMAPKSDADIQKCIQDKLANAPKLKTEKITAAVSNGEATLTGNVKAGKGAVTGIAKSCGAKKVTNNIVQETKPGAKAGEKKAEPAKKN